MEIRDSQELIFCYIDFLIILQTKKAAKRGLNLILCCISFFYNKYVEQATSDKTIVAKKPIKNNDTPIFLAIFVSPQFLLFYIFLNKTLVLLFINS